MVTPTLVPGLWLLHVDLDTFLASVEIRRDPSLRGRPVVVGGNGDPAEPRKVVAAASYQAREHGVRAGMPLRTAHRKCPDAVFLPTDNAAYDAASAEVMDVLRGFGHPVEVWGWDEAFVGATVDDPVRLAQEIRRTVADRTGLTCGIGIGDTKERAKMATGFAKIRSKTGEQQAQSQDGTFVLSAGNWLAVMGERPVGDLWGIGAKTAAKLTGHGIHTVAELAAYDHEVLAGWFGPTIGPSLKMLARGGNDVTITTEPYVAKSRGKQVTYPQDLTSADEIERAVRALAEDVRAQIVGEGRVATHVGVTVRTATFYTRTKTSKLAAPTTDPAPIAAAALRVLSRFEIDRPVRLLGIRLDLQAPAESAPAEPVPSPGGSAEPPSEPGG